MRDGAAPAPREAGQRVARPQCVLGEREADLAMAMAGEGSGGAQNSQFSYQGTRHTTDSAAMHRARGEHYEADLAAAGRTRTDIGPRIWRRGGGRACGTPGWAEVTRTAPGRAEVTRTAPGCSCRLYRCPLRPRPTWAPSREEPPACDNRQTATSLDGTRQGRRHRMAGNNDGTRMHMACVKRIS